MNISHDVVPISYNFGDSEKFGHADDVVHPTHAYDITYTNACTLIVSCILLPKE